MGAAIRVLVTATKQSRDAMVSSTSCTCHNDGRYQEILPIGNDEHDMAQFMRKAKYRLSKKIKIAKRKIDSRSTC
jgi:hypothetical protein